MVYRKKGRFVLDIDHLQSIVDDVLRRRSNKDVKISIKKSPNENSKSLYVDIALEDCAVGVRISDHRCKGDVRGLIIDGNTGNTHIYYAIERAIKGLKHKRLKRALGEI